MSGVSPQAIQAAAALTWDQHGPKPGEVPSGCARCEPGGWCPLFRWAELVLAGEWPAYPQAA